VTDVAEGVREGEGEVSAVLVRFLLNELTRRETPAERVDSDFSADMDENAVRRANDDR